MIERPVFYSSPCPDPEPLTDITARCTVSSPASLWVHKCVCVKEGVILRDNWRGRR